MVQDSDLNPREMARIQDSNLIFKGPLTGISIFRLVVLSNNLLLDQLRSRWFDLGCVVLKDPANNIDLQVFTQAVPVPTEYVMSAQDQTPSDYNLRWSGLSVTVGQVS